jgi:hypothetical protein
VFIISAVARVHWRHSIAPGQPDLDRRSWRRACPARFGSQWSVGLTWTELTVRRVEPLPVNLHGRVSIISVSLYSPCVQFAQEPPPPVCTEGKRNITRDIIIRASCLANGIYKVEAGT